MTVLALNTYAGLVAGLGRWALRSSQTSFTDEIDNFILLSTAAFNLYLNPYQQETTTTITTSASGVGTLPADFQTPVSLVYSTYPALVQTSVEGIKLLNQYGSNSIPAHYAITGPGSAPTFILDAAAVLSISLTYVAGLATLSNSNTTNWLLTAAPHAYLYMGMAQGEAFNSNWSVAEGLEQKAYRILDQVQEEATTAKFGRAAVTLRGVTP